MIGFARAACALATAMFVGACATVPAAPGGDAYRCGGETYRVAFADDAAQVTLPDGTSLSLPREASGGDPEAPRGYGDRRLRFVREIEGMAGPRVLFARGRMTPVTCAPLPDATGAVPAGRGAPPIAAALPSLSYDVDFGDARRITLRDGRHEEPAAPGSASTLHATLGHVRGYGDYDGDGRVDAATTLVVDGGGSGRFVYLALVLDAPGGPRVARAVLLGDRVRVERVTVRTGGLGVDLCDRAPGAPMASQACTTATRRFVLRDGALKEVR